MNNNSVFKMAFPKDKDFTVEVSRSVLFLPPTGERDNHRKSPTTGTSKDTDIKSSRVKGVPQKP